MIDDGVDGVCGRLPPLPRLFSSPVPIPIVNRKRASVLFAPLPFLARLEPAVCSASARIGLQEADIPPKPGQHTLPALESLPTPTSCHCALTLLDIFWFGFCDLLHRHLQYCGPERLACSLDADAAVQQTRCVVLHFVQDMLFRVHS